MSVLLFLMWVSLFRSQRKELRRVRATYRTIRLLRKELKSLHIALSSDEKVLVEVPFEEYYSKLADQCALNVSCLGKLKETEFEYFAQDDFRMRKPDIKITVRFFWVYWCNPDLDVASQLLTCVVPIAASHALPSVGANRVPAVLHQPDPRGPNERIFLRHCHQVQVSVCASERVSPFEWAQFPYFRRYYCIDIRISGATAFYLTVPGTAPFLLIILPHCVTGEVYCFPLRQLILRFGRLFILLIYLMLRQSLN